MALDYKRTADKIIEYVGGKDNIASATHCMTRLRLILNNESKADDEKVRNIKGVKSVIKQGGQYQIVIGNEVSNLFKEFHNKGLGEKTNIPAEQKQGNIAQRIMGSVAGCLTPILPAMLGTGMLKVVLTLCTTIGIMETTDATYMILYAMADGFFYFLPIFLGWSIAKKTGGSIPLYLSVGAMLCYPELVSLMSGAVEGVKYGTFLGSQCTYLFGVLPVIETRYTSSVFPMLLMAPVMKWAENFADRVSPNVLKSFLKPLLFLIICAPCVMVVLGPLGGVIGNGIAIVFNEMYNAVPWLTVAILSALMPFIVMTGMHYALLPITMNNIATLGWDVICLVTMFCSNICQGGAAFGVAGKTKDVEVRSEGIACGISATIAGVTEPALYGINLRYGKPMIGAVIGSAVSGLLAGLLGVRAYSKGAAPSFLSLITFIGGDDPYRSVIRGVVCGVTGLVISCAISYILYNDKELDADMDTDTSEHAEADSHSAVIPCAIYAPISGQLFPLSETPDEVFASGDMGLGVAIEPAEGKVYAPADGEITTFFPTGHAIGITTDNDVELLIHVGMNTVNLDGRGFTPKKKQGDKIKKGDLLLEFDITAIRNAGYPVITPVIVTNTEQFHSVTAEADKKTVSIRDMIIDIK